MNEVEMTGPRSPAPRTTAILARGGVPRAVLPLLVSCVGCSVPVAHGLDEAEANQVVATLEQGGVAARKEPDRQNEKLWRITVLESASSEAVTLMANGGPVSKPSPGLLESLGDSALLPSAHSEQLRTLAGTAGELERTLREVDGVKSARVHLALAPTDPLASPENASPATASVLLRYRAEPPPITVPEVQRLVAGAVPGLSGAHVSVVLKPAVTGERTAPPYARVGPLLVSKASAAPLRWGLATALLSNIALTSLLLWLWARQRRLRHEVPPSEGG